MYPLDENLEIENDVNTEISSRENKAFYFASFVLLLMTVGLVLALLPEDSLLRAPDGTLASFKAPIMQSIVALIFIFTGGVGVVYGVASGKFKSPKDFTKSMEDMTHTLVQLVVFYFFAAQFLYAFNASQIGAILAPIFIPMLMGVGISPELTQASFRISDNAVNVVTPMFAFYPLIITYCQKYVKESGIGTLSSMMLPYTVALLIVLTVVLYSMWFLDIPLGLQADYLYPRP